MPSLDDNEFIGDLPPGVMPLPSPSRPSAAPPAPRIAPPPPAPRTGAPTPTPTVGQPAPGRARGAPKPGEEKKPEFPLSDGEAARPLALERVRHRGGEVTRVISIEGVIGDLDDEGLDLLAGYIARINGIGYTASVAFQCRNPGGFGSTLDAPRGISPFHLLPLEGSAEHRAWMTPLFDDYRAIQRAILQEAKPKPPRPVVFERFEDGGAALIDYLKLIQQRLIPYFFRGPMTPISDILLCYQAPCVATTTYPWSALLPFLRTASFEMPGAGGSTPHNP